MGYTPSSRSNPNPPGPLGHHREKIICPFNHATHVTESIRQGTLHTVLRLTVSPIQAIHFAIVFVIGNHHLDGHHQEKHEQESSIPPLPARGIRRLAHVTENVHQRPTVLIPIDKRCTCGTKCLTRCPKRWLTTSSQNTAI